MELLVNHLKATKSNLKQIQIFHFQKVQPTTTVQPQLCDDSHAVILPKLEMDCIPLQINNPHPSSRLTLKFGHHVLFWALWEGTMVADNGLTLYT